MRLRVAVLGASGFGRHHARWYAELGCEVVAFLGSSPSSIQSTGAALAAAFGFSGRGYTSLKDLLATERCDAVSICTPWALHGEQAAAAIDAGCSVLCEKPFVWRPGVPTAELLAEAARLAEAAEREGVVLAVNTQYVAAAELYRSLAPAAVAAPTSFVGEMTSRIKPDGPRGRDIWLDLAPHCISMLIALCPDAELRRGTVRGRIGPEASRLAFEVTTRGRSCAASIYVAKLHDQPFARSFGCDGHVCECTTRPDGAGVYRGHLRLGDREESCDDFMRTSMERFCTAVRGEGEPLAASAAAVRNMAIVLEELDEAEGPRA